MSGQEQFSVRPTPDLVGGICDMAAGNELNILNLHDLGEPFDFIDTQAALAKPDIGPDYLQLSSAIGLLEGSVSLKHIARQFARELYALDDLTSFHNVHEKQLGLMVFDNPKLVRSAGLIVPAIGGKIWLVSNSLEGFEYFRKRDKNAIELFVGQHALALNAFVSAVSEYTGLDQRPNSPRTFFMNLPESSRGGQVKEKTTDEFKISGDGFEVFAGIDSVVSELRDMVRLANMPPDVLARNGVELTQAVLLYGPSGVGKTALMRALADALEADIDEVSFSEISGVHIAEWARKIETIFERAYKQPGRVLIIFDEMEGLIQSGNPEVTANITAALKRQLEAIKRHPNVFVAAATNNIDAIDPVIRADKRIPLKLPIQLPEAQQRAHIWRKLLFGSRLEALTIDDVAALEALNATIQDFNFTVLADMTEGFSGGDISEVIAQVNKRTLLDSQDQGVAFEPPTQIELAAAIKRARLTKP